MQKVLYKLNRYFQGKWRLGVLDFSIGHWVVKPKASNIPYLKAENANGRHIIIQPEPLIESFYLLVDDLPWHIIQLHHKNKSGKWKPGRMIVETSPNNYQAWIHSARCLSLTEKRYWLEKLHNDPGADPYKRWGRCPGFRNRKEKYQNPNGDFPLSKLIWIDWINQVSIPSLSDESAIESSRSFSPQPRGGVCRNNIITRSDYWRSDESSTDFSYALALIRRGHCDNEIKRISLNVVR